MATNRKQRNKETKVAEITQQIPTQLQKKTYRFIKTNNYDEKTRNYCTKELKKELKPEQEQKILAIFNKPKAPIEQRWTTENHYRWDEPSFQEYLKISTGYGIMTGRGDLAVIDSDHPDIKKIIKEKLPKTFTIRTGGGKGHYHFYFECKLSDKIILKNDDQDHHYGEVQWNGAQVIGPGSIHPSGNKYIIVRNNPIVKITAKQLITALKPHLTKKDLQKYFKRKDVEIIEDESPYETIDVKPLLKHIKGLNRQGDEYTGSHPIHGSTTGKNFSINIEKNTWYCFRCTSGGGAISLVAVLEKIIECGDVKNLSDGKFQKAKVIAKKKYGIKLDVEKQEKVEDASIKKRDLTIKKIDAVIKKRKKNIAYVSSFALPDDIYLEEILHEGKPAFIVYDKRQDSWTVKHKVKAGKITYKPIPVTRNLLKSLILPEGVEEYGSLSELRKEMHDFALNQFDPSDQKPLYLLSVDISLTSWISPIWQEKMAEKFIPIINPRGGSETGKKRVLTVNRWLTYHSRYILKTERIPSLFRCLKDWNATLVMDEADIKDSNLDSELVQFLNSRCDGIGIPRYDVHSRKIDDIYSFGLTVLATRAGFTDDGLSSRCFVIPTAATDNPEKYDLIPPKKWLERGKILQKKLLLFRLRHMNGEMPTQLLIEGISSFRVRETLLILQGLKDEDETLMKDITELATEMQQQIIKERAASPDGLVINAVYNFLIDSSTVLEKWQDSYIPIQTLTPRKSVKSTQRGKGKDSEIIDDDAPIRITLTLKAIRKTLGEAYWNEQIAKIWRTSFHQGIISQKRIDKKKFASTIQILNLEKLHKTFPKYIEDYYLPACMGIEMEEKYQDDAGELSYDNFEE